jgi:hemerythrin-like domain-containing protein
MRTDMEFMNRLFHDALRRDLDRMIGALTSARARPESQRAALAEHVTLVLDLLHHHHTGEDEGLWPLVRHRAPDLAAQLDTMEAEHASVARSIGSTRTAAARYAASADPAAAERLREAITHLRDVVLPHLEHEETEVMPRVMRALSERDWSALARREVRTRGSFAMAGTGLVWMIDGLEPQRRAEFDRQVSAPFRWLVSARYGGAYRRRTAVAFAESARP